MLFAFVKGVGNMLASFTSVGFYCLCDKGGRDGT